MATSTDLKTEAIFTALYLSPPASRYELARILAMLTSAIKDERESAKDQVRDWATAGRAQLVKNQLDQEASERAYKAAAAANRFDPDEIAP